MPDTLAPRPTPEAERAWMHVKQRGDVIVHVGAPPAFFATCEVQTVSGYWCPDGAPLPPDVVARALEQHAAAAREQRTGCHDCGRPYGDEHGFPDLVVPHEVWNRHLSPTGDEGGLLCPSCMCKRAHAAGLREVPARFTSGPFVAPSCTPAGEVG